MSRKNREDRQRRNRIHRPRRNRDPELSVGSVRIPLGAIVANPEEQAPNNSYLPPVYYADTEIRCVECATVETWTAEQQHWWYEIAKGAVDSTAVRCRSCRRRRREERERQRARSEAGRAAKDNRGDPV